MKIIITGSTGMVGKGVLLECVEHPEVTDILVVNRSPLGKKYDKVKEVLAEDFFNLSAIEDELSGYDACFFCLGTTAAGKSREQYTRITYDLTMNFARQVLKFNPEMTFIYVSGVGTSTEMNSRMMWANVKGRTENDLLSMGFKDAYMFRPGLILPVKGVRTKMWYQILYDIMRLFNSLLKRFSSITDTARVGQAMINVSLNSQENKILEPTDINKLT